MSGTDMQNGVTTSMARRIELWPVDRLQAYARNPRTHSEEQVLQLAASIAEFGFTNPILVDTKAGIIAGHGRLLAARKLGLAEVPVIVLDHLSESQKRAYIIADNRLALNAGWDEDLLERMPNCGAPSVPIPRTPYPDRDAQFVDLRPGKKSQTITSESATIWELRPGSTLRR